MNNDGNSKKQKYNAVICGSDQVWNRFITGDDNTYLLNSYDFSKKISYAASLGASLYNENHCKIIAEQLRNFDAISVRESEAKTKLSKL